MKLYSSAAFFALLAARHASGASKEVANDELPVAQQQHRKLQTIVPSPLVSTKCMQDNWKAAGNKQDLVCEAKEVWLENMAASRPATCVAGGWTTLDLSASVVFNAERYDMGWYIATDGGTALTGQCVIKPLLQKDGPLSVVDKPGSTKVLTNVTWTKDFKGGNDLCGDIIGGGGTLDFMRIGNNVQLPCIDKDGDGILDFGICFSWKVAGSDTKCNPVSLFPGTPSKCFCARYNIPQIQVLPMPKPVTTFFIPLPEESLFKDVFFQINADMARPPVVSLVSVTISTDKTIVWVDHWEDGYDLDVGNSTGKTTEIWGDGNAANGCRPDILKCTNSLDVFVAGDAVVIQNTVVVSPRVRTILRYDGGDRIQASFPIAVTRAAYPANPGSVLAGSVEVLDTTQWGLTYEAPVGVDLGQGYEAFELTLLYYMAGENNTIVTLPNGTSKVLQLGETGFVKVKQSDRIVSNKPIQVDLITGDIWSGYELRWYSMRPIESYSNSYVSPVGDSFGKTKVVIYNPGPAVLTYTLQFLVNETKTQFSATVNVKQAVFSPVIPTGSGAWVDGTSKFIALSLTDSEYYDGTGVATGGQWFDWGFPLVPRNELTSQVLIGLGFACTNNNCQGQADRSVVWLSPLADADVYIDYKNTGVNQKMITVLALQSVKIVDTDQDMSGAIIFAVQKGAGKDGVPVDIAVAWGQDPSVSRDNQAISLDLGTVVLPITLVKVAKLVDKVVVLPGEEMLYTIRVSNVGQKNVAAGALVVKDILDADVSYIPGSAVISPLFAGAALAAIPDDTTGTPFPLDQTGFAIPVELPRRGGTVDITFKVKLASTGNSKSKVVNKGKLSQIGGSDLPFEVTSAIDFGGAIMIENTVYRGAPDSGAKCGTNVALEYVEDYFGSDVTYCFKLTNTGKTLLGDVKITNADLNYTQAVSGILEPGATRMIFTNQKFLAPLKNNAVVVANPLFSSGLDIPDANDCTATDPSEVGLVPFKPSVSINNTVYMGTVTANDLKCNTGVDKVKDIYGSNVTYCFTVKNTGDSHLNALTIRNRVFNFTEAVGGILPPGQTTTVSLPSTIIADIDNVADVTATPVLKDGQIIFGNGPVTSSDPSGVAKLSFSPSILVENTVYLGKDNGKRCGTAEAIEFVSDFYGADVTYCFKVLNTGDTHLNKIELVDPDLSFSDRSIGTLAPGNSTMLSFDGKITGSFKNTATATGKPIMADGRPLLDLKDVTFSDPSAIGRKTNAPNVDIENTVLLGNDAKSCGTSAAKEYVEDYAGSNVTYCFTVKNNGDTYLDNIVVTNGQLSVTDKSIGRLAPGVAAVVSIPKTILGKLENTATVTANPTLKDGTDIPDLADVTKSDTSSVGQLAYVPAVKIENTVYGGDSEPILSCGSAVEYVEDYFGKVVTYCFKVTNVGNTFLDTFRLDNDKLSFQDQTTIKVLAPGASALISVQRKINTPMENLAKVTARPCKQDGSSLLFADVTNTDPSSVGRIAHKPSVSIDNTVYIGVDGLCGKGNGADVVRDIFFTAVVYCLKVTNTGDTHLDSVSIEDKELEFTKKLTRVLAPGDSELISIPGKIQGDLNNTAIVKANPTLEDGTDIAGINDVTSSDPSAVEKLVFEASVQIANTVYLGNDGIKKCATAGESVKDLFGSNVTFCFKVTNTGKTHLRSISLSDTELVYAETLSQLLAPGESLTVPFSGKIAAPQTNIVNVTATPITADGREILDLGVVKASDPSGVEMLGHTPSVTIANTVYLGDDGGKSCAGAVEKVEEHYGSAVTYCLKVTNTGNSYLKNMLLVDELLGFQDSSIGTLAPGGSATITVPGKITGNLTNVATVTGTPSLMDGTDIPKLGEVKASDPSSVEQVAHKPRVNVENTVFLGKNDEGTKCASGETYETVKGYPKTDVMYCFEVKNAGDSYLKNVVIANSDLSFKDDSIKMLAPGEVKIVSLPGSISGNLINTANVTATPCLKEGTIIPTAGEVRDSDPSAVEQQEYAPKVLMENSVYVGRDGGKQCGTSATRETVDGIYGTEVTYCLKVTNVGDTTLSDITIVNELLGFTNITRPLAPGESITVPVDRTIVVDLKNNAIVTANPVTKDLSAIPGLKSVSSQDPSGVDKLDFVGGVKIVNRVYLGADDNGAKCGSDSALESVAGTYATEVTYCFKVINTGDTYLADIVVGNDKLSFKRDSFERLAPGYSIFVSLPGTITADLENLAVVTANPVTADGKDIPDLGDVSSEDISGVRKLKLEASVLISNTVYLGDDGDKKCGSADAGELVKNYYGSAVTYCFLVTNTGKSFLKNVVVKDTELSFVDESIDMLAPGATKLLTMNGTISSPHENIATVTGLPCLKDGTIIPETTEVTFSDPSAVDRLAFFPRVTINNLVLLGNDEKSCGTAVDYVEHYNGAVVTYCFEVTNKGDSYLSDVVIVDKELIFTDGSIGMLAPGDSVIVTYTSKIDGALGNTAVVTANPTLQDGTNIPDTPDCTWADSSAVGQLEYFPSVTVDNKVYIGDDLGKSCAAKGVEKVVDKMSASVVYCFNVTNTGDTYLSGVKLVDTEIGFTDNSIGLLAPGASTLIVFSSTINGNVTNNAVVTANPCLRDGADISGAQDVTATDPSEVNQEDTSKPMINIENTVFLGKNDEGAKCASGETYETVKGYPKTEVMYCFEVKNAGDSYLKNVVIANSDLSFRDESIKTLAPGTSKIVSLPGAISGSLTNTANVTATPCLKDGTSIANAGEVRDSDPSAVEQQEYAPKVLMENTVYVGRDGGKQCGMSTAQKKVDGIYGTEVTYCLKVTNVGDTTLSDITIASEQLGFNNSTRPLAPGESITVPVERTIVVDLVNDATVTANPVTKDLKDIPGLENVKSQDSSEVDKLNFVGGVTIVNKVYLGASDNGAKCVSDSAQESVTGIYSTEVTYCFTVTNTGDSYLANMVVGNDKLSFKRDSFERLAPGHSFTVSVPGTITKDLQNLAIVTANPVTAVGKDIPDLGDVRSEDLSGVLKVDPEARVTISNTVYLGSDGGNKCGSSEAVERVKDVYGSAVTYCFFVTNTGKSSLNNVVVEDKELVFVDKSVGMLAPGMTRMLSMNGTISDFQRNTATVTGLPCLTNGTIIPDAAKVTASDPSEVDIRASAPFISINNLVVLGDDDEACSRATDYVKSYNGAVVTYCFEVTNNGDSYLNNVAIVNSELSFTDGSIGILAPGDSALVAYTSKINGDLKNTAVVTANPTLKDGKGIPNAANVTAFDSSSVGQLAYTPSVKVDNKVYVGDDLGISCAANGVEKVVDKKDAKVVFCFNVTNTGDTYLNGVQLVDKEIGFTDNSIGLLAPGNSTLIVFVSTINGNVTNNVVVTANPCLINGVDISGVKDVTATDPSEVNEKETKGGTTKSGDKDFSPPKDGPQVCLQDKWQAAGNKGDLVCASKEVFVESMVADQDLFCSMGETITISVKANILIEGSRNDLGWYVANDGGDALTGTCIVNGLQSRNTYPLSSGSVKWTTNDGADGDECGDVVLAAASDKASLATPFLFEATLPCADDDGNGLLDVAVCFTWRSKENNDGKCVLMDNIPGAIKGGCYCTKVEIPNVQVDPPPGDPVAPC